MDQHPEIDDPVLLRDHAGREFRSRVVDRGAGLLVVERPALPEDEALGAGIELDVKWTDADGVVTTLPTRILSAHEDQTLGLWSLVVTGPASVAQRRRFERTAVEGSVLIHPAGGDQGHAVAGGLVDVGEGGVRCTVAAGAADWFLIGPREVVAEFRLGDADFAVPGTVEFLRATTHPSQLEDLVVVFDEPVADAAALRTALARVTPAVEAPDEES